MWGVGGPVCIISFICHVPLGMTAISSLGAYKGIQGLGDIYDVVPGGRSLLHGFALLGHVGTFAFAWNFVQFGTAPFCCGYLLAFFGMLDLAIAIVLTAGAAMVAQFLPGSYGPCNGASDWNNGTDGRNLFLVANATGGFGDSGPDDICRNMVMNWILAIVVVIIYLICAIYALFMGCFGEKGTETSLGLAPEYDIDQCPWLVIVLQWLLKPVFYTVRILHGSLYIFFRYASKYRARNRPTSPLKIEKREMANNITDETRESDHQLRLPMELVILITQDLHYTDLVNIYRSSRYLQHVFFGDQKPLLVARELRQFACRGWEPLKSCGVCGIQTCTGCLYNARVPESEALQHLTGCRPACSRCFYTNHCLRIPRLARPGNSRHGGNKSQPTPPSRHYPYALRDLHLRPDWDVEMARGNIRTRSHTGAQSDRGIEEVCRNCAVLHWQRMQATQDAHYLREVQRQAEGPLACYACRRSLCGSGVRWWVDPVTKRECKWDGHPGWARGC